MKIVWLALYISTLRLVLLHKNEESIWKKYKKYELGKTVSNFYEAQPLSFFKNSPQFHGLTHDQVYILYIWHNYAPDKKKIWLDNYEFLVLILSLIKKTRDIKTIK